jgi:Sugar-transfer associated ATP-grasp
MTAVDGDRPNVGAIDYWIHGTSKMRINRLLRINKRISEVAHASGRSPASLWLDFIDKYRLGYDVSDYFGMMLYKDVPENYLPHKTYHEGERLINPRVTGVVGFSKWVQYGFFKANGIPQPTTYGFINRTRAVINGTSFIPTPKAVCVRMSDLELPVLVKMAPVDGQPHIDVLLSIDLNREQLEFESRGIRHVDRLLAGPDGDATGILLQELLVQHKQLDVFHPVLNTLRIITHIGPSGEIDVPACFLKLARTGSRVDNLHHGAIAAHVDQETGRLEAGFSGRGSVRFTHHPDTGAAIEGFAVPYLQEAVELAKRAHPLLQSPSLIGWDVAVTDEGPKIIEANSYLSFPKTQKGGRGLGKSPLAQHLELVLKRK